MEVAPGDTITVSGTWFGTECNDTGQVPEDELLGPPATDITVALQQNSREWLVAQGNAQDDWTFTVKVDVPRDLTAGTVTVITEPSSFSKGNGATPPTFTVVEHEPTATDFDRATTPTLSPSIATFPDQAASAPSPPSISDPEPDPDPNDSFGPVAWVLIFTGVLASLAALILFVRGRHPRQSH